MPRAIRTTLSGQVIGSLLCLVGFAALFVVFWKAWPNASASGDLPTALWSQILTQQVSADSFVTIRLTYLTVMGTAFLILGSVALGLSRQIFYLSGESTMLQCPYCRNQWKARRAMGWAECPYCSKFIQPQALKPNK
jgi:hypothetical protein